MSHCVQEDGKPNAPSKGEFDVCVKEDSMRSDIIRSILGAEEAFFLLNLRHKCFPSLQF